MLFYAFHEIVLIVIAAIVIDMIVGDPPWPTHPVIRMGSWTLWLQNKWLYRRGSARQEKLRGAVLVCCTLIPAIILPYLFIVLCTWIHPWLGYAVSAWLISTTIAIKGLKQAAYRVLIPLHAGNLTDARKYVGWIVGRDTAQLDEQELTRATVETVSENVVDAVISPIVYALLGGAPLAMGYRAANTLDSMVGYRNEKYLHFGWASARLDDMLNYIPARITGILICFYALLAPKLSSPRALRAILQFAHHHPSPNSGIPESAAAGAMGVRLGGRNYYQGIASDRAYMGWPIYPLAMSHMQDVVRMLYGVSYIVMGVLMISWVVFR